MKKEVEPKPEIVKPKPMRIYLSGKIGNLDRAYYERCFKWAENFVRVTWPEFGEIVSPIEVNPFGCERTYKTMMLNNILNLWDCHAIAMLPGWERSQGARIEYAVAKELDLLVFYIPEGYDRP